MRPSRRTNESSWAPAWERPNQTPSRTSTVPGKGGNGIRVQLVRGRRRSWQGKRRSGDTKEPRVQGFPHVARVERPYSVHASRWHAPLQTDDELSPGRTAGGQTRKVASKDAPRLHPPRPLTWSRLRPVGGIRRLSAAQSTTDRVGGRPPAATAGPHARSIVKRKGAPSARKTDAPTPSTTVRDGVGLRGPAGTGLPPRSPAAVLNTRLCPHGLTASPRAHGVRSMPA